MSIPVFVEFVGTLAGLKSSLDAADREMSRLSRSGASSMQKMSMLSTAAIRTVGIAAAGIGVASVTAAAQFQKSMEMVHTQAGASQAEVDKLSKAVLNLAPQVGTGPDELAVALYHIESTLSQGLPPAQRYAIAMQQLRIAAEGAKVGGANLEDVTNALNATMASGMVRVGDMSKAMGALNAVVGAGDMHMQDLAQALGTGVLAVVKGYGVTLNDVGAALATFGDNNIRGADAATDLRTAVQALAVPAKGGLKVLEGIGISAKQLGTDMRQGGLVQALDDLHGRLVATGNDGTKAGALLTAAFGKKAGPGLQVLMEQFSRFQQKVVEVRDGANGFGSAWQATTKTFAYQFDQAKVAVETLGIKLGTVLIPYVERAAAAVTNIVEWLQKHNDVARALAVSVGTVLATALAIATQAWIAASTAILASPITWIVAGLAAVAGGLYELYQHSVAFRGIVQETWRVVSRSLTEAWAVMWPALKAFGTWLATTAPVALHAIENTAKTVWSAIGTVIKAFLDGPVAWVRARIAELVAFWSAHFDEIRQIATIVWKAISIDVTTTWTVIRIAVEVGVAAVKAVVSTGLAVLKGIWATGWDLVRNLVRTVWSAIVGLVDTEWHLLLNSIGVFLDLLTGHWSRAWSDMKHLVGQAFGDIRGLVAAFVSNADMMLYQAGRDMVMGLVRGIESAAGNVTGAMSGIAKSVTSGIGSLGKLLPHFAQGGLVGGGTPGVDSVPLMAMPGEWVVKSDGSNLGAAMAHFGLANNTLGIQRELAAQTRELAELNGHMRELRSTTARHPAAVAVAVTTSLRKAGVAK